MRRLAALLAASGVACLPRTASLDGRKCDRHGQCVAGYGCLAGLCVRDGVQGTACRADGDCQVPLGCEPASGTCQPFCDLSRRWTKSCGISSVGRCRLGVEACAGGKWGGCAGEVDPGVSVCDGQDDDCDGVPDDHVPPGPACADQEGVCAGAAARCLGAAGYEASCSTATYTARAASQGLLYQPGGETACDGEDNDCDGVVDDGPGMICALGESGGGCITGCGSVGTRRCNASCTGYDCVAPREVCNGTDDDCDGAVDQGLTVGLGQAVVNSSGESDSEASLALSSLGGLVAYLSDRSGASQVYVASLDASLESAPAGNAAPVSPSAGAQSSPVAVALTNGFAVGWLEGDTVKVQLRGPTVTLAPSSVGSDQARAKRLALAPAPDGVLVAWEDGRDQGSAIYAALVSESGASGEKLLAGSTPAAWPALAPGGSGFALAYEATATQAIMLQPLDPTGAPTGDASPVSGADPAHHPTVAPAAGGAFAVAWQDETGTSTGTDIAVRVGTGATTLVTPAPGSADRPSLVAGPQGTFAVAFEEDGGTSHSTITVVRLTASGQVARVTGGLAAVSQPISNDFHAPSLAFTGATYAVAWNGSSQADGTSGIFTWLVCP